MANCLTVNSDSADVTSGTTRYSTARAIDKASLLLSNSEEKYIPGYLRPSRGSCHDNCKFGKKLDFVSGSKYPYLDSLGKKLHHNDPFQVIDLSPEERRKILATKKKLLFQDKPRVIMQKAFPQFKEPRLTKQSIKLSLQSLSISHKSTAAGGNEITSLASENEQLSKGDGNMKREKGPKLSALQKARSSLKPNVPKEALKKRNNKLVEHQIFKQRALVPSKVVDTFAESSVPFKTNKTPSRTRSPRTVLGLIGHKNEGCKIRISSDSTKMIGKKELKSKVPCKSCKTGSKDLSSLKQRKYRHELPVMKNQGVEVVKHDEEKNEEKTFYAIEPKTMNFGSKGQQMSLLKEENVVSATETTWKSEIANLCTPQHESTESKYVDFPDAENFEFKTEPSTKLKIANLDSSVHESLVSKCADFPDAENFEFKTEPSTKLKIANLDSSVHESLESKCADLPDAENFAFETKPSLQLEIVNLDSSVHESPESKYADFYIQEKSSPHAENLDVFSVTEKLNVSEIAGQDSPLHEFSVSKSADLCFPEQSSPKAENLDVNCLQQKSRDNLSSQSSVTSDDDHESCYVLFESSELESEYESGISSDRKTYPVTPVINLEENLSTDYKWRFRRGKTIAIEPESHGPVRLKFQRTIMGDQIDNGGQVGNKCCLRTSMTGAIVENRDPKEQSILLRHQDTQEKKDLQGLLNIVLEETASRLAQCRKSKVQALVGAFETVISLRDKKSASTA